MQLSSRICLLVSPSCKGVHNNTAGAHALRHPMQHDADQPLLSDGHMAAISEHSEWSKRNVWGYIDTVTSGSKVVADAHDEKATKRKAGFWGFAFQQSLYRCAISWHGYHVFLADYRAPYAQYHAVARCGPWTQLGDGAAMRRNHSCLRRFRAHLP
jgi:hypothetical protein